jgi:hypothetical protein
MSAPYNTPSQRALSLQQPQRIAFALGVDAAVLECLYDFAYGTPQQSSARSQTSQEYPFDWLIARSFQ